MRLDFYRKGRGLIWDLSENGYSLLGQSLSLKDHDTGFFVNPTVVSEHEGKIAHLPLTKSEALHWLIESGLIPGDSGLTSRSSGKKLRDMAQSLPLSFPPRISLLLSSHGVQAERVKEYSQTVRPSPMESVDPYAVPPPLVLPPGAQIIVSEV